MQNQIEQIGVKYHLSGFAAIEADTIRAETARSISAVSHALKDSIAKKEVFAAMLRSFITRLETDPVAGMSDFADDAARLRDAVAVFEREERAFANAMNETVTQLGGIDSDIETMRKAATRDPVTGLPNRIAFSAKLTALYDDGKAVGPAALALGHRRGPARHGRASWRGNRRKGAEEAGTEFRKSVKKNDFVARIGTDEFAFVFHDVSADNAEAIAQRICVLRRRRAGRLAEPGVHDADPVALNRHRHGIYRIRRRRSVHPGRACSSGGSQRRQAGHTRRFPPRSAAGRTKPTPRTPPDPTAARQTLAFWA